MIQLKIQDLPSNSRGDRSGRGAISLSRLLALTIIRPQGRDDWQFLDQAWIAPHRGGVMPAWRPDP
ncbi:MAG TPA: hypothetical protein DDY43_00780 [Synechococcales bacterium UBA10510]|nr:hypothetical protein [Synechococcales bacterium UBA10510]